jgi:purine-binding chemotaxis protein CheW
MQVTESKQPSAAGRQAPATVDGATTPAEQSQYLTFLLGDEMFAIGILSIREIIEYGYLTEVPMTPPFIRGVINLRGAVVPVVDLAVRFGREARETTKRTCIVIVEVAGPEGSQEMGIVVDAVSEVLEIPRSEIEPPPEFGARVRSDFIQGMGKIGGKFVVLLDANRVLSVDEVAIVSGVSREGPGSSTGVAQPA